jgi:hypothetical protein
MRGLVPHRAPPVPDSGSDAEDLVLLNAEDLRDDSAVSIPSGMEVEGTPVHLVAPPLDELDGDSADGESWVDRRERATKLNQQLSIERELAVVEVEPTTTSNWWAVARAAGKLLVTGALAYVGYRYITQQEDVPDYGVGFMAAVARVTRATTKVVALSPTVSLGYQIANFPSPVKQGFPNLAADVRAKALGSGVDPELLVHLVEKAMFTSRSQFTARDLKFASTQWMSQERKSWSPEVRLDQQARAIAIALSYSAVEQSMFDYWQLPSQLRGVAALRRYAADGSLPGCKAI